MERINSLSLQCMVRKDRKNRKEQYPVYLRISVGGKRTELITNVVISLDKWNAARGRVKGTVEETRRWNHLLDNLEQKAREIYNRHLLEGKILSSENIKNEITGLEHVKRLLIATFKIEVSQMQLMEGNGYATGTTKNWQVTLRHLKEFLKDHYRIEDISFRQLDHRFITDLDRYARNKWKCKTNAVLKHFQRLQKVVKIAHNIKDPHRYVLQGSDTTMMPGAASLFGQKYK
ncbi:MAG: phage integrase SAM-like domain-containing protein [Ferruginibacter sp.]|nr:phage integrase SAM-like domain-containing protein [Ferruginibacter sp.]